MLRSILAKTYSPCSINKTSWLEHLWDVRGQASNPSTSGRGFKSHLSPKEVPLPSHTRSMHCILQRYLGYIRYPKQSSRSRKEFCTS